MFRKSSLLAECIPLSNLALRKNARQSSELNGASPGRAVDGDLGPQDNRCAGTDGYDRPDNWWMVDLGQLYAVRYLVIFSRNGWSRFFHINCCLRSQVRFYNLL